MKPFDDKDVRWALSHYIDRQQIIDVAYLGAETVSALPMPPYKPLLPYFDAVKDLLAKYNTLEFNPKKGDALLAGEGLQEERRHVGDARTASRSPSTSSASAPPARPSARCCRRC